MGVLSVIDAFYVERASGAPVVGDIYWSPVPFVDEVPRILDATVATPASPSKLCVREAAAADFSHRTRGVIPGASLRDTEEAVVIKAKRRPVVVLSAFP